MILVSGILYSQQVCVNRAVYELESSIEHACMYTPSFHTTVIYHSVLRSRHVGMLDVGGKYSSEAADKLCCGWLARRLCKSMRFDARVTCKCMSQNSVCCESTTEFRSLIWRDGSNRARKWLPQWPWHFLSICWRNKQAGVRSLEVELMDYVCDSAS